MITEQIRRKSKTNIFFNMNLQEALKSKGFKQSDVEIKIPQKSLKTTEKEDKVTKESKKE